MPLYPKERMKFLLDDNTFEQIDYSTENQDVLGFKDLKKYSDRLKDSKKKTELVAEVTPQADKQQRSSHHEVVL